MHAQTGDPTVVAGMDGLTRWLSGGGCRIDGETFLHPGHCHHLAGVARVVALTEDHQSGKVRKLTGASGAGEATVMSEDMTEVMAEIQAMATRITDELREMREDVATLREPPPTPVPAASQSSFPRPRA